VTRHFNKPDKRAIKDKSRRMTRSLPASSKKNAMHSKERQADHFARSNPLTTSTLPRETATARPLDWPEKGAWPCERIPVMLETGKAGDFHLIDSGDGLKLERYGRYRIIRPEAQALWPRRLPEKVWNGADAVFTGDVEEEGAGRWRFAQEMPDETWPLHMLGVDFLGRFTAFRHVGVFAEQAAHWSFLQQKIRSAEHPVTVLNLFGYTGLASLIAARAGARVTHVDASRKAIAWARENQARAQLTDRPIRWICDDATKFVEREMRRGRQYDIILSDPPKFGRGPNGEVWNLFDDLASHLLTCRSLLSDRALAFVVTAYSIRASFFAIHGLMRDIMRGRGGLVESGELLLRECGEDGERHERLLSTSLFSRWTPA